MLRPITSSVDDSLVGVEARMQHLISNLQIGSGGKRMIGIWGVGGGGKTTLASTVYGEISSKFDGCCFLKNIREESSNKNGLERLQEKILCSVLKQKEVEVGRVEEGRCMIMDRLQHRMVLIVLDDIDNLEHLERLAGSCDWFGEGSRIIITTRDEHVLTGHKVDVIHNMSLLDDDEAMKLFCKHAPRGHRRIEDYKRLSKHVVSYAGGLPLALRVLGRFLCDKEIHEWRSALDRLKQVPDANILEVLKVSFNGLTPLEKELFLDIACFFRWKLKDEKIMMILNACGFNPVIGIKVLIQKALITLSSDVLRKKRKNTISSEGSFDMHDLVQEMGHPIVRGKHPKNPEKHSRVRRKEDVLNMYAKDVLRKKRKNTISSERWFDMHDLVQEMGHPIVRGKHPKNPEKHSRVWRKEDVLNICAMDAMTIEVISLRCSISEAQRVLQVAASMKKLRWIDLNLELLSRNLDKIESELVETTLPLIVVPENFPPRQLSCLTLSYFNAKQVWEGCKFLPNLRMIRLKNLSNLMETPDFDGLSNLESFMVDGCYLLEEIHPSFGRLKNLVFVEISRCHNLNMVPPITRSMKLETFVLSSCLKLFKSSKIQQSMKKSLPQNMNHIGLWFISRCLRKLDLSQCNLADGDIKSATDWELPNLQELNLNSNKFSRLNFSLLRVPRLKWLDVSDCFKLVELSDLPSSISVVIADECNSLESIGDISNCKWLWKVSLLGNNRIGLLGCDLLLDSMFQGNAKDHFISINLSHSEIWRRCVPYLNWVKTFTMLLPHDWYTKFCGILMFVKSDEEDVHVKYNIQARHR